ncbi:hypothetical protein M1146_07640 [Patescibacteria group bacterium]|nr:hypothetical protein [Patescibacteria group bacterium]
MEKGVAVTALNPPIFAIFAVLLDDKVLVVEPQNIQELLEPTTKIKLPERHFVLPWVSCFCFSFCCQSF